MSWVNLAVLSAVTLSVVNILDSHLISRRMPSLRAFLLLAGIIVLIYSLVLFYLFPLPGGISPAVLSVAVASSIFRVAGVVIMLYMFQRDEVSRVVPVAYTYPIFVAIMAVLLLGERLYYLQWLAIIIVVAGAVMISVRLSSSGDATWLGKPFLLLSGASLLFALGDISSKYVLSYMSFWNLLWFSTFSLAGVCLVISVRTHVFRQLGTMKQKMAVTGLLVFNEAIAIIGVILLLRAIQEGPVSLVSTINASRPIFVVLFALVLSRVLPAFLEWQRGGGMLALRLVATAMIVGGITIIYLT